MDADDAKITDNSIFKRTDNGQRTMTTHNSKNIPSHSPSLVHCFPFIIYRLGFIVLLPFCRTLNPPQGKVAGKCTPPKSYFFRATGPHTFPWAFSFIFARKPIVKNHRTNRCIFHIARRSGGKMRQIFPNLSRNSPIQSSLLSPTVRSQRHAITL
jgi:hypothetical protein